jgi:hypothetical protein
MAETFGNMHENASCDADVQPAVQPATANGAGALETRGNLSPLAALKHGAGPVLQRGELPGGSEFALFRDVLEQRRREALAWVGGSAASVFDRDDCEAFARWATAADILWGVLEAEGLLTRTRRRKARLDYWERCDKRASYYRELLRARKHEKNVSDMSAADWLEHQSAQQTHQDGAGAAIESE